MTCPKHSLEELSGKVPSRESPHPGGSQSHSKARSVHREKQTAKQQEEKKSEKSGAGSSKASGSKRSRPEVQLYVPRGRRQCDQKPEEDSTTKSRRGSDSPNTDSEASLTETCNISREREHSVHSSMPGSVCPEEKPYNLETVESHSPAFETQCPVDVSMDSDTRVHKDVTNFHTHNACQNSVLEGHSSEAGSSMEDLSDSVVELTSVESMATEGSNFVEQHQRERGEAFGMSNIMDVQSALCTDSDETSDTLYSGQCESPLTVDMGDSGLRFAGDSLSGLMPQVSGSGPSDNAVPADVMESVADAESEFTSSSGEKHSEDLLSTSTCSVEKSVLDGEEQLEECSQEWPPVARMEQPREVETLETVPHDETGANEMCPELSICGSVDQTRESSTCGENGHSGEGCVAEDSTSVSVDAEERCCESVTTKRDDHTHSDTSANSETVSNDGVDWDCLENQQDLSTMSHDLQKDASSIEGLSPDDTESTDQQVTVCQSAVARATSQMSASGDGFQTGAATSSQENEDEEDEEDSWDTIFDDNGDCLDPSMMEEVKLEC